MEEGVKFELIGNLDVVEKNSYQKNFFFELFCYVTLFLFLVRKKLFIILEIFFLYYAVFKLNLFVIQLVSFFFFFFVILFTV